jgi:hypothetical protein
MGRLEGKRTIITGGSILHPDGGMTAATGGG